MPSDQSTSTFVADGEHRSLDATYIITNSYTSLEMTPDTDPAVNAVAASQHLRTGWKTVAMLIVIYILGMMGCKPPKEARYY